MSLIDRTVSCLLPWLPRRAVARVARRYIAGRELSDAERVVRVLSDSGASAVVDVLGENVHESSSAESAAGEYIRVLERLAASVEPTPVAIKPSHLGLHLDADECTHFFEKIVIRARELGTHVEIDMESSSSTDATLRLFDHLRVVDAATLVAIQACLHRSRDDVEAIARAASSGFRLRICKGIYREPSSIALHGAAEIRESFLALVRLGLDSGGFVAIATHDPELVNGSLKIVRELDPRGERHEFQMLLGVGHRLRKGLLESGHIVRVYCPFGPEWYPYSLRRLRENPAIAGQVLRSWIRELFHRHPGPTDETSRKLTT